MSWSSTRVDGDGTEGVEPDDELHPGDRRAGCSDPVEHRRRQVQPCGRRCCGRRPLGEDRLVALLILEALGDVRRQRCGARTSQRVDQVAVVQRPHQPPTTVELAAHLESQLAAGRGVGGPLAQLARRTTQRLPPPVVGRFEQEDLAGSAALAAHGDARRQDPGVVQHDQVARPDERGQLRDDVVLGREPGPPVDQEARRVTRLGGRLRDAILGEVVVELVGPHPVPAARRAQKPMERPMISFMISVVPP